MSDAFQLIVDNDLDGLRQALASNPGIVYLRHPDGASLVAWAAYVGNVGAIAAIRAYVPELDGYEAIILGETTRLEAVLANGWDANVPSRDGFLPLALAAFFGNATAFDRLLPLTRDINLRARNPQQVAPLHAACARRDARMVEALLRAGADPNLPQADGFTPLHAAAHHGDAAIAGLLLLFGSERGQKNDKGDTAADSARAAGHDWLAAVLERSHQA
jgi:ankyrin repeat protein